MPDFTPDFTALCPGCFAEKGKASTCPHCGYDESQKRGPLVLPHRTLLNNGQYLIGKVLGKPGGFGITYLAFDTKLETKVAIKEYLPRDLAGRDGDHATISAHSSDDAEHFRYGLTQFLQEARTLARFDHANIVRVRNFFEENGTGYLVMDYYDGITLADYLAQQPQGKLPEKVAVDILMPILDGLREVHAKNFLHRDIKPQNIYLTTGNRAILLDFGAARQAMSERSRSLSVVLSEGYAPYEQYHRRGEQGTWTDIYACAAVLYHAVAGEPPPPATERMSKDELDIGTLAVSASLANALRLGLAVDHMIRPRTMTEFQGLLLRNGAPPVFVDVVKQRLAEPVPSALVKVKVSPPSNSFMFIWVPVFFMIGVLWFMTGNRGTESSPTAPAPLPVATEAEKKTAPTVAVPVPATGATTTQAKREVPRFSEYETDMKSANKYLDAIADTPIEVCQAALERKSADGAFCLAERNTGDQKIAMLKQSAELGHPYAQNNLAVKLDDLKRPELSPEIRRLILSAARRGVPQAQVSVGWWSMTGENGFSVNYAEAMEWNLKGYKQGHSEGANNIGELYEKGYGVTKDIDTAKSWYQKASELGNPEAAVSLKRLNR